MEHSGQWRASDNRCFRPQFYGEIDAVYFHINDAPSRPLVLDVNSQQTLLTTSDLAFNGQGGIRATLGYRPYSWLAIESLYFGISDWNSSAVVTGDNSLQIPPDLGPATDDFFAADRIAVDYATRLHNIELNLYHRLGDSNLEFLAGFRRLTYAERFNIRSGDPDIEQSDYTIVADNRLHGGQLGLRWNWREGPVLGIGLTGKAGVFANSSKQSTLIGDQNNNFVFRDVRVSHTHATFVGEIGINASLRLREGLYLKGGYSRNSLR